MKLTKQQLVKIIKEVLLREGSEVGDAFSGTLQLYKKAFDMGFTPEQLEQLEEKMDSYWTNLKDGWRDERENWMTKGKPGGKFS
tara:strand:+ start:212 stop:463 length:252 start_codon:yes stop_codon:yes gene_type:complete